jgi:GTP-binding protein Era
MQKSTASAKNGSDVILFVLDGTKKITETDISYITGMQKSCENIIVIVNKTDATTYEKLYPQLAKLNELSFVRDIIPTSAIKGKNIEVLINKILEYLPNGEPFFEQDIYTNKSVKFMVAEIVREKMLWLLQNEIPHGVGVEITSFKEGKTTVIDADIICEKESHKQIVIGKDGQVLKNIGTKSREDIEKLLNSKVFLNLFVKVRKNWRDNSHYVADLGYSTDNE